MLNSRCRTQGVRERFEGHFGPITGLDFHSAKVLSLCLDCEFESYLWVGPFRSVRPLFDQLGRLVGQIVEHKGTVLEKASTASPKLLFCSIRENLFTASKRVPITCMISSGKQNEGDS